MCLQLDMVGAVDAALKSAVDFQTWIRLAARWNMMIDDDWWMLAKRIKNKNTENKNYFTHNMQVIKLQLVVYRTIHLKS